MTTRTCIKGKHTEGYRYNTQRNLTYVVPKKGKKGQTCPGFLFRWRIVSETRKHALDFCFVGGLFLKLGNMDLVCKSRTLFPTRTYILAKRLRAPTQHLCCIATQKNRKQSNQQLEPPLPLNFSCTIFRNSALAPNFSIDLLFGKAHMGSLVHSRDSSFRDLYHPHICLLYTSDAADE